MQESQEKKNQSLPLNYICQKFVKGSVEENSDQVIEEWLQELKVKKRVNYKTLTKHVQESLQRLPSLSIQKLAQSFITIGVCMEQIGNKKHQTFSLLQGYKMYFAKREDLNKTENKIYFIETILNSFLIVSHELSYQLGNYLFQLWRSIKVETKYSAPVHVQSIILKCLERGMKNHWRKQCLTLAYHFNLYDRFQVNEIASWMENQDVNQIKFGFQNKKKEVQKSLIKAYIERKLPFGVKDIKNVIGSFKLSPEQFPQFLEYVNRKALNYLYNEYPSYFLDVKLSNRPDLLLILTKIYIHNNKMTEAIHFINKYRIKQLYNFRGKIKNYQNNPLLEYDRYLPTQCIVNNHNPEDYITLKQVGYKVKNVKVIDKVEDAEHAISVLEGKSKIGIDCEFVPSYNGYEEKKVALAQLATKSQVFLFDIMALKNLQPFRKKFINFFTNFKGKIIGHTTNEDYTKILHSFTSEPCSKRPKIVDIRLMYMKKCPQINKSSLQHIVNQIYKKKLSKFEQCSGWDVRPLRKSQIHYAALDAILPLQLYPEVKT